MAPAGEIRDLEEDFARVAVALFSPGTVPETLRRIVVLATHTVDGCDAAGVLVIEDGAAASVMASDAVAVTLDQLQADGDEGPCRDAAAEGHRAYVADLVDDPQWPIFAERAVALGVRSVLALPLSGHGAGALGLYGGLPLAFGATSRAQGQLFATLAGLALESAEERAAGADRALHLTEALRTREMIGQAQGILMERERITADQAFAVLRRASQHMNRKLREVAALLVEGGESPDTG